MVTKSDMRKAVWYSMLVCYRLLFRCVMKWTETTQWAAQQYSPAVIGRSHRQRMTNSGPNHCETHCGPFRYQSHCEGKSLPGSLWSLSLSDSLLRLFVVLILV